jgi:glycosyltransferase involved in cell wall biosynthesis
MVEGKLKKVNYIFVTPYYPNKDSFYGNYIHDQVKAIKKLSNYNIIVVKLSTLWTKKLDYCYTFEGFTIYNYQYLDLPFWTLPGIFNNLNKYLFLRFISKLIPDLSESDIVHSHVTYPAGVFANFLKEYKNIKFFIQHHSQDIMLMNNGFFNFKKTNYSLEKKKSLSKKTNRVFIQNKMIKAIRSASLNISVSKLVCEIVKSHSLNNSNNYLLYNGVDTNKFFISKDSKINNNKLDKSTFVIGCVGNFFPKKGQLFLLESLNILEQDLRNKIEVKFVGTGPTKDECILFSKKYLGQNNITFTDSIKNECLIEFYNSLDLFVLPSSYEGLGCVYLEAHSCGVPFIGIKGQGIDEWVPSELKNNLLCNPYDVNELSDLIHRHLKENISISKLNYNVSINSHIQKFLDFINNI